MFCWGGSLHAAFLLLLAASWVSLVLAIRVPAARLLSCHPPCSYDHPKRVLVQR